MRRVVTVAALVAAALVAAVAASAGSFLGHAGKGPTKLTIWVGWSAGTHELRVFKSLVAEYDKSHPEVDVSVVGDINDTKIVAAIRSGTAPDVVS